MYPVGLESGWVKTSSVGHHAMACVTLKRPIDVLGSPHLAEIQPLAKRKRCGPPLFATTPSPSRGVKRAKRRLDVDDTYSPNSGPTSPAPSPFLGAISPTDPGKNKVSFLKKEGSLGSYISLSVLSVCGAGDFTLGEQ